MAYRSRRSTPTSSGSSGCVTTVRAPGAQGRLGRCCDLGSAPVQRVRIRLGTCPVRSTLICRTPPDRGPPRSSYCTCADGSRAASNATLARTARPCRGRGRSPPGSRPVRARSGPAGPGPGPGPPGHGWSAVSADAIRCGSPGRTRTGSAPGGWRRCGRLRRGAAGRGC